jgi:glycopeptide antibiotics resistance protein
MQRNRLVYSALIVLTLLSGLASRQFQDYLPTFLATYAGDTLWALLVFLLTGFLLPKKSIFFNALVALIFSFGIEISQLYHAAWIDAIRQTRLGGLILGFGFLWSDLLCYTAGIGIGALAEVLFRRKN